MGLHIRHGSSRKVQLITMLFAAFALVVQPLYGLATVRVANAAAQPTDIVINEIAPATGSANKWIELYNTSAEALDISKWRLVRGAATFGNVFPSGTVIDGHDFYIVESTSASLPLNGGTNPVQLWTGPPTSSGKQIDSVDYGVVPEDQSYGRKSDGGSDFQLFATPSKNAPNISSPSEPAITPASGSYFNSDVTYQWSSQGADHYKVTRTYMNDGQEVQSAQETVQSSDTIDGLNTHNNGPMTVKVCAVNVSGQTCRTANYTFDATPPAVHVTSPTEGQTVGGDNLTTLTFSGSITDSVTGVKNYRYQVLDSNHNATLGDGKLHDGAPTDSAFGSWDVTGYEGAYYLRVWATDNANNSSPAPHEVHFMVDHTGPTMKAQVTSAPTLMASSGPISLAGNVKDGMKSLELLRDGSSFAHLTDTVDSNGDWSYVIPKEQVVQGTYRFSLLATDDYGNTSKQDLAPIAVTAYLPGAGSTLQLGAPEPLTGKLIVPSSFVAGTTQPFTAQKSAEKRDTEVLGVQNTDESALVSGDLPAVAATESGWKIFGIAWYWWALIFLMVMGGIWWTASSLRRRTSQLA